MKKNASQIEIKKAFRKLSMKYHPDRAKTPQEKEQFQQKQFELNNIMNILGNPEKRQVYDEAIKNHKDPQKALDNFEQQKITGKFDFLDPNSPNFDPTRKVQVQEKANDTIQIFNLTLKDSYIGKQFTYKYNQTVMCPHCKASGASNQSICPVCQGKGKWTEKIEYLPGKEAEVEHVCEICRGTGTTVDHVCEICHGRGFESHETQVPVIVMPGVYQDAELRFESQGNCNLTDFSQQNGDLVIKFQIQYSDGIWRRQNQNLYSEIQISLKEAIFGFEKTIQLPNGKDFVIQRNQLTQPEQELVFNKMGFSSYGDQNAGDMIIKVHVLIGEDDIQMIKQIDNNQQQNRQQIN